MKDFITITENKNMNKRIRYNMIINKIFLKMLSLPFMITFLFFSQNEIWGQTAADYTFSYGSETYTAISGSVSSATGDDGTQSGISIGFTFNYCGTNYTTFNVSTNGHVYFGSSSYYSNDIASTTYKPLIAPLWDDLYDDASSDVQYSTTGVAPNRILTVQWRNLRWNGSSGAQQNFQLKLYETSNVIKFIYGTMSSPSSVSASIGINDQTGGSGRFLSVTPAATPTVSSTSANNSISASTYLTTNLTYVFTPNTCVTTSSIIASAITATTATISWNAASPAPSSGYEYEVRTSGAAGSGAGGLTTSGTTAAGVVTKDISGLTASTTYYVYVRSNCGSGNFSSWTNAYSFVTTCNAVSSYPWNEGFEGVAIPAFPNCWYKENGDWATANSSSNTYDADPRSGSQNLINAFSATNEYIWTPGFSMNSGQTYNFSFWWAGDTYTGWTGDVFYNTSQLSTGATQLGTTFVSSGTTTTKTYAQFSNAFVAPSTGTYYFAIRINANSTPWYISFDDFQITTTEPASTSTLSSGVGAEPSTISSLVNTQGASSLNFDFKFTDDGVTPATDATASQISQIVFSQGTGNTITTWSDAILGAELNDGTNSMTGTINASNITFSSISNSSGQLGYIADNAEKTYTLKIWLKTTLGGSLPTTIDGQNFVFQVTNSSFTFSSGGLTTGQSVNSGSSNNVVDVTATKLVFQSSKPPATATCNTNFNVSVDAVDANGNRDLLASNSVTLAVASGTGILSSSTGLTRNLSSGTYAWTDVKYTPGETMTIQASATGLTSITSGNITVSCSAPASAPVLYNSGSTTQLAFNNSYINSTTPVFRVSATHTTNFNRFQVEINTTSAFSGTAYTQTFTSSYASGSQYDLTCNSLSPSLPTTSNTTYFVRVRASADGGSNWSSWSSGVYSFTYKTSGEVEWYQVHASQLATTTQTENIVTNIPLNRSFETGTLDNWTETNTAPASCYGSSRSASNSTDGSYSCFIQHGDGTTSASWTTGMYTQRAQTVSFNNITQLKLDCKTHCDGASSGWEKSYIKIGSDKTYIDSDITGTSIESFTDYTINTSSYSGNQTLAVGIEFTHASTSGDYIARHAYFDNIRLYGITTEVAHSDGVLFSSFIDGTTWGNASWTTSGANGSAKIQVEYWNGSAWALVPDGALSGNSSGFSSSPLDISALNTTTYSRIRLRINYSYSSGRPSLASWKISPTFGNQLSDIISAGGETDNIPYENYQAASSLTTSNAVKIGTFTIRDGGASSPDSDSKTTTLTDITFAVQNFASIRAMAIFDGTTNLKEVTSVVASTSFNTISGLVAPDNSTKSFDIYATFKTLVTDNQQVKLTVSSATSSTSGSMFAASNAGGAETSTTGNKNKIIVTATKLIFTTEPSSSVCINVNLAQAPIVKAVDVNNNVDVDFNGISVGISNAGSLGMSNSTALTSSGVATFNNLQFTAAGTAGVLTTTNVSGLSNNSCATSITVGQTPATPGSISGTTTQCPALTNQTYSITAVSGATTYTWNVPAGWSITSGQGTISIQATSGSAGQNGNITVTAGNTCGTSTAQTLAVTVANGTPAAPTSNAFTNLGATSFTANWSTVGTATSYRLDVSTSNAFASYVTGYQDLNVGNVTNYSVTGLATGTKYYYRVRAVNSCGTSANSTTQTAFTKKYLFTAGSGQEYTTIQGAMDDVYNCWLTTSFDADVEVRVFNGTYTEAVTSNSALAPNASGRLLIKAASGNSPIIDGGSSRAHGIDMSESYVTISGFIVRNHTADGIKIAGGNNIIENNIVHNNGAYNIIIYGGGNNNEVAYNKCYGTAEAGIWVTASSSANIHHNLCYDHTKYGIYLSASANSAIVKNNTLYGNGSTSAGVESNLSTQGFNDASNPTGWTTAIITDTGTDPAITYVSSSSYPSGYNKTEGANMVRFNSYTCASGAQMRLYQTSSFSTSGKTNIKVQFDWLQQSTYNKTTEGVLVQYSTNGSSWTNVTFYPSYNATTSWTTISCTLPAGAENQANLYIGLLFTSEYGNDCYLDNLIVKGSTTGTTTGSGLYLFSSTNLTSSNNIMYAKTGGDYYAVYIDGLSSLTASSGWNNIYSTGSKLGYYGSDKNSISDWNTATPGSNDDLNSDPLFVTNGSDFHLKSEAASGTYAGGSWPPGTISGGTWTQYSGQHSPSIDVGNPADAFANESAYNGDRINQGCYGNTVQASKASNDKNSKAIAPDSQTAAGDIPSTSLNIGSSVEVFKFKISDLGATGDGMPTKVTSIKIKKIGGTADWSDHIAGAGIFYAGSEVANTGVIVTDNDITISFNPAVAQIPNGTSTELSLKIWLNTSNIVDNSTMQFGISQTTHGFVADASGSTFATDFGAAITGNTMTVRVTATKLVFETNMPPAIVPLNSEFFVKVIGVDDNGNFDENATNNVTLTTYAPGTGILFSASNLSQSLSGGIYQWSDISYNTVESFKIKASSPGLTDGISILINCIDVPGDFSITAPLNATSCNGNITISWNSSAYATSYDLYYTTGSSSDPVTCVSPIIGVTSPYTFNASNPLTLYKFKILAINPVGQTWSTNVGTDSTRTGNSWIGGTSTNWSTSANWCGNSVPTVTSDVIFFPGTLFYPTLTANSNVRDIIVESGVALNTSTYTLNVYGNYTNNGVLEGNGTINFTGTSGTQNINNGSNSFYNLTINKSSGSAVLNTNNITIRNNLLISAGTFDANNLDITLSGNWTDNGTYNPGTGTVTFNGSGASTINRTSSEIVIFSDGFENGNQGWTMQSISGNSDWRIQSTGSPYAGSYNMSTYDINTSTANSYCQTCGNYSLDFYRDIDLSEYSSATLNFYWKSTAVTSPFGQVMMDGVVLGSISNSSSWNLASYSINSYCGAGVKNLGFRFYIASTSKPSSFISIDNVEIKAISNIETFNKIKIEKTGAGSVSLGSSIKSLNDIEIVSGILNTSGKFIKCNKDFVNNGTFNHNNGEVLFIGNQNQCIKGTSNTSFYKFTKNSTSCLTIGDNSVSTTVEVLNSFKWTNNSDTIIVGNGLANTFKINDNLNIQQNCVLETRNGATVSVLKNYTDFGKYTPNNGIVKFHGAENSNIIREPAYVIFSQDFETGAATGWTLGSDPTFSDWRVQSGFGHASDYDLAMYDVMWAMTHDYDWSATDSRVVTIDAVSPVIDLSAYSVASLKFWYRIMGDVNDYGQVLVKVNGVETLLMDNMRNKPLWTESNSIDISNIVGGQSNVQLIFRFKMDGTNQGNAPGLCIDDIVLTSTSILTETFNTIIVDKTSSKIAALRCPVDINSDVTINQGTFDGGGFSFPVGGNWSNVGTSSFIHRNNTITFDGNGESKPQSINIGTSSFYKVILNNPSGTATLSTSRFKVESNLTLTAGALDAGNQNIEIGGHWLNNGATFIPQSQQVEFYGTANQNITSRSGVVNPFYTIEMNKDGSLILQDSLTLNKDFKLIKGLLDVNTDKNIRLKGDWLVGDGTTFGTFNPGTAMVTFNGTSPQVINKRTNGTVNLNDFTFYDLKIDGTNVTLWLKSSHYKVNTHNLYIVKDKVLNIEGQP